MDEFLTESETACRVAHFQTDIPEMRDLGCCPGGRQYPTPSRENLDALRHNRNLDFKRVYHKPVRNLHGRGHLWLAPVSYIIHHGFEELWRG